jgi:hypothetical protein
LNKALPIIMSTFTTFKSTPLQVAFYNQLSRRYFFVLLVFFNEKYAEKHQ